jgi:hypothetical protein
MMTIPPQSKSFPLVTDRSLFSNSGGPLPFKAETMTAPW